MVTAIVEKKSSIATDLAALLAKAFAQSDELEARNSLLEQENAELRQRVEKLERERGVPSEKPNFEWQQVKLGEPAHSSSYKGNR